MNTKLAKVITHREFLKMCGLAAVGAGAAQLVLPPRAALAADQTIDGNLYVTGSVGIGTTGPTAKLHVVGSSSANVATIRAQGGSAKVYFVPNLGQGAFNGLSQAGDMGLIFDQGAINTGNLVIAPWYSGYVGIRISSAGRVTVGSELWVNSTLAIKSDGVAAQAYYA